MMKFLRIGKEEIPVTAKPDTRFRVGNELGFAILPEKSSRKNVVAFSFVSWVAVSPVEQGSPDNILEKRLKELVDAGRVIDVQPSR